VQLRSYRRPMSWPGMTQSVIGTLALTRRSGRNPRSGCLTTKWRSGCQVFSIDRSNAMEIGSAAERAWCGYESAWVGSRRALSPMRSAGSTVWMQDESCWYGEQASGVGLSAGMACQVRKRARIVGAEEAHAGSKRASEELSLVQRPSRVAESSAMRGSPKDYCRSLLA
jgi:hypothetical protein